jgi:hypothetical protein
MGEEIFSYRELAANLAAKLEHPDFVADLEAADSRLAARTTTPGSRRTSSWSASAADSREYRESLVVVEWSTCAQLRVGQLVNHLSPNERASQPCIPEPHRSRGLDC